MNSQAYEVCHFCGSKSQLYMYGNSNTIFTSILARNGQRKRENATKLLNVLILLVSLIHYDKWTFIFFFRTEISLIYLNMAILCFHFKTFITHTPVTFNIIVFRQLYIKMNRISYNSSKNTSLAETQLSSPLYFV